VNIDCGRPYCKKSLQWKQLNMYAVSFKCFQLTLLTSFVFVTGFAKIPVFFLFICDDFFNNKLGHQMEKFHVIWLLLDKYVIIFSTVLFLFCFYTSKCSTYVLHFCDHLFFGTTRKHKIQPTLSYYSVL